MFVVQKRDSVKSSWHTCQYRGKKCRFSDIAKARIAYRHQKEVLEKKNSEAGISKGLLRIFDTLTGSEVE